MRNLLSLIKMRKRNKKSQSIQNADAKKLYALAFNYKCKYPEDEVYFSFSIPYSYTQCQVFLEEIVEKNPIVKNHEIVYVRKEL